jgi:hypothetical protein
LPLPTTTLLVVLLTAETGLVLVDVGVDVWAVEGVDVPAVPFICASMLAINSFRLPDDPMVNDILFSLASGCSSKRQSRCHAGSNPL